MSEAPEIQKATKVLINRIEETRTINDRFRWSYESTFLLKRCFEFQEMIKEMTKRTRVFEKHASEIISLSKEFTSHDGPKILDYYERMELTEALLVFAHCVIEHIYLNPKTE